MHGAKEKSLARRGDSRSDDDLAGLDAGLVTSMKLKIKKYYEPDPALPVGERLKRRLTRRPVPSFPRNVQIQTMTGCNADCIFCPYGETFPLNPKGRMDWDMFRSLLEETARWGVRRLSPYLMNEPFLDPEIFERLRVMHEINPKAKIVVTSNGGLLTPDRVDQLLDLGPAVHSLYLSVQGIDKESYEATMRGGMRFERTLENIDHLLREQERRGTSWPKVWVTMVDTDVIDARAAVEFWSDLGVRSKYTKLENRGGNIRDADAMSRSHAMEPFSSCTRLFKQAYVLFDGDVTLCCTDYRRSTILGNIRTDGGLYGVWNGERARKIRRDFLRGDFSDNPLCGECTIDQEVEVSHDPNTGRGGSGRSLAQREQSLLQIATG